MRNNRTLLENDLLTADFADEIDAFVDRFNYHRCRDRLDYLATAEVCFGRLL